MFHNLLMSRTHLDAYSDRMADLVTGTVLMPAWSPGGGVVGFVDGPPDERQAWRVDLTSGEKTSLIDAQWLRTKLSAVTGETPAGRGIPFAGFAYLTPSLITFGVGERVLTLDLDTGDLGAHPLEPAFDHLVGLSAKSRTTPRDYLRPSPLVDPLPMPELPAPDGSNLLSVQDGNLILRSTVDGRNVQLTTDGSGRPGGVEWRFDQTNPMHVALGVASPTTCWSPDGRTIAAYRVDGAGVSQAVQVHYLKREDEVVYRAHARAGGVLEKNTLHLIDTYGGTMVDIDLGETRDTYPVFASWLPDCSGIVVFVMTRDCRRVDVVLADARTGAVTPILTETGDSFVRIHHDIYFGRKLGLHLAPDGRRLVWASERDGWKHLYLYDLDGTLVRQLTSGEWPIDGVTRVTEEEVWFTGFPDQERPYDKHLLRVPLDGGAVVRVTDGPGVHDAFVSPDGRFLVDTSSTPTSAPVHRLRDRDGALVTELSRADTSRLDALPRVMAKEEEVLAADGETKLWATVYLPPDFNQDTTYPCLEYVYGGPQIAAAPHSFFGTIGGIMGATAAAWAQMGYVTVVVDARGTPLRSKAFHDAPYPRWASCMADDHAATIRQLAERYPIDLARVGVFGGSWGGYTAFRLAADQPDLYRAAVAFAPGFDPYSSVLYECYLGMPQDNKEGYDFAQPISLASHLRADLMIVGGTSDHATWTDAIKMSEALIRAGKQHEFVVMPEQYHGFDAVHSAYFRTKLETFFAETLKA